MPQKGIGEQGANPFAKKATKKKAVKKAAKKKRES